MATNNAINSAGAGGSSSAITKSVTASNSFAAGNWVTLTGSATYGLAQADSAADAEVVGIVIPAGLSGSSFTICTAGYVTGLSGLTANTIYFLSAATPGAMTATAPSAAGNVVKPVFYADTTTSGYVVQYRGDVISANAASSNVPTQQFFTSGSGTYTKPANVLYLIVEMVGGGAGGGAATTNAGTNGGNSTFSTLTASGGTGGTTSSSPGAANGGSASGGDINITGGQGASGSNVTNAAGGYGGISKFGGGGSGGPLNTAGYNSTSYGGGGGGGGGTNSAGSGGGGGAGGYVYKQINSPAATYSYAVGAAGTGGAAGIDAGGNGSAGFISVTEYYQ